MQLKVEKLMNVYHNRALSAKPGVCAILPLDRLAAGPIRIFGAMNGIAAATRRYAVCAIRLTYHAGLSRAPCRDNPSRLWYDSSVSSYRIGHLAKLKAPVRRYRERIARDL